MSSQSQHSKTAVNISTHSSSSSSQSSTSVPQTDGSSSSRIRRSNSLNYQGQYEESSDDDYELFEDDNFEIDDVQNDESSESNNAKKRKTSSDTHVSVHSKKSDKQSSHTRDNQPQTSDTRMRKKHNAAQSNKNINKLVWVEKRERTLATLPVFKQHTNTHDYTSSSPYDMFHLFFPAIWFVKVVALMNSYSRLTHHFNINTNVNELRAFISMHIYMGIHRLPRMHMYWQRQHQYHFITSMMSRDRFKQLNAAFCLHLNESGVADDDPAIHCKDFIDHLNTTLPTLHTPGQHLSFDEAMCAYTGRSSIKQYLPAKPHPYGYKMWCVGSSNYIMRIRLYEGASDVESQDGKMCDLVNDMMSGFENKDHILYCDNYFTSVNLLSTLYAKRIYICGSVNLNRLKLPKPSPINDDTLKSMQRFDSKHYQCEGMSLVMWKDNKIIKVLYNHISPTTQHTTTKRYNENHESFDASCPQALHDYFHRARDVDIFDQLSNSYIIGRKSTCQRTRLIWWLVNLCVVNAYTLYEMSHPHINQLDFRVALYKSLAAKHQHNVYSTKSHDEGVSRIALACRHYTDRSDSANECVVCSRKHGKRVRTRFVCTACAKHMCMGKCFSTYHTNSYNQ